LPEKQAPPLGEEPQIEYPAEKMSRVAIRSFLEGQFSIIKHVGSLPAPVLQVFTEKGGSRPVMADPGKNFEATDFIVDGTLPRKRLIFAGVSGDKCFVQYEQGGIGHFYVLALYNLPSQGRLKPLWWGSCPRPATNIDTLRTWVANGSCSQP
jgi:hypothetical protein